jgi:hypothetical protein
MHVAGKAQDSASTLKVRLPGDKNQIPEKFGCLPITGKSV